VVYTFLLFDETAGVQATSDRQLMNEHAAMRAAEIVTGQSIEPGGGAATPAPGPAPGGIRRIHP
jgi:hypothetical protein